LSLRGYLDSFLAVALPKVFIPAFGPASAEHPVLSSSTHMDAPARINPVPVRNVFLLRLLFALVGLLASAAVARASTVATPVFSPAAGTYTSAQTVAITSVTSGASIRYTTDGSTPSATAGNLYAGPLTLSSTTTLKVIAFKTGLTNSAVKSGLYTIKAIAPVFSPAAGTYTSAQAVTITTTTSGASIRYTTDGSAPSATAGNLYSGPVSIGATTTLKAIAYASGLKSSNVTSGNYRIHLPPTVSLTAPAANSNFAPASTITLTATAGSPDSTVSKVVFYQGSTKLGTATSSPYAFTWKNVAAGAYSLTAVATDKLGVSATSSPVPITVNIPPTVTLTAPANGAVFIAPAPITLTATASDSGGTISKVDFYQGSTLLGTATTPVAGQPSTFSFQLSTGLPAGNYTLTAVATDNLNVAATSSTVTITVNPQPVTFTISPVSFTYNGSAQDPTITPSISGATYSTSGTASATSAGSYTVTATATGNYTGTSGPIAWTIAQATPTITWATPAPIVYGTALDSTQLNATAKVNLQAKPKHGEDQRAKNL
jgi:hypothetical protein